MERLQRLTVVLALALLLVGGLNLTARAIHQVEGGEKKFLALDLKKREIVVFGHPYRVGALLDRGRSGLARLLEAAPLPELK